MYSKIIRLQSRVLIIYKNNNNIKKYSDFIFNQIQSNEFKITKDISNEELFKNVDNTNDGNIDNEHILIIANDPLEFLIKGILLYNKKTKVQNINIYDEMYIKLGLEEEMIDYLHKIVG